MNGIVPGLRRALQLRWLLWASFAGLVLYALFASTAEAAAFRLFDPIVNSAQRDSKSWFNSIQSLVRPTFLILGTLEVCWAATVWALEKDSLNSLSVEIIKKIMCHGFFYALLLYAQDWIPTIVGSFEQAGETAVGIGPITTDSIMTMGLDVIAKLWANTIGFVFPLLVVDPEELAGFANPVAYAALALGEAQYVLTAVTTVIIALAYVLVAAQFFCLKVESCVLFAVGAIFLGFGGSEWTQEYVKKYLNYAINVGVRLLVLILILSLTLTAVTNMSHGFHFAYDSLLGVMAAAVLQAVLAIKAPDLAGALMNGTGGLTAGGVAETALNTMAQLRMAGITGKREGEGGAAGGGSGGGHGGGDSGGAPSKLGNAVNAGRGAPSSQPNGSGPVMIINGLGGSGIGHAPPASPGGATHAAGARGNTGAGRSPDRSDPFTADGHDRNRGGTTPRQPGVGNPFLSGAANPTRSAPGAAPSPTFDEVYGTGSPASGAGGAPNPTFDEVYGTGSPVNGAGGAPNPTFDQVYGTGSPASGAGGVPGPTFDEVYGTGSPAGGAGGAPNPTFDEVYGTAAAPVGQGTRPAPGEARRPAQSEPEMREVGDFSSRSGLVAAAHGSLGSPRSPNSPDSPGPSQSNSTD